VAGTTRDAIDTPFLWEGHKLLLIDTAGIRRSGKIQGTVEYYSVLRAQRAIERCDVALTVIDSDEGLADGDKRVAGMAHEAGKAGVLVVNKWDVGRQQTMERMPGKNPLVVYTQMLRDEMPFVAYAPVAFCSALRRTGIGAAVETALSAAENHSMRIPTGELNRIVPRRRGFAPAERQGADVQGAVRDDGQRQAAHDRAVRQRPGDAPLRLPALPREPDPEGVRVRGHADPAVSPARPMRRRDAA
jgi:GTP-binding protein